MKVQYQVEIMKIRNRKSRNNENYAKIRATSMLVIVDKTLALIRAE